MAALSRKGRSSEAEGDLTQPDVLGSQSDAYLAVDQVAVRLKGVGGRVVPHPALKAEWVRALGNQEGRTRVPERMKPDSCQPGAPRSGLENLSSEGVWSQWAPVGVRKHRSLRV